MKKSLNINKLCFLILNSVGIGLGSFASAISLLTNNIYLESFLLLNTYFLGILLVYIRRKYPLFKEKL